MQLAKTVEDMAINPNDIMTPEDVQELFGEWETNRQLEIAMNMMKAYDLVQVVRYVVFLYSEDSVLNVRPPMPLDERQMRALDMAGFETKDGDIDVTVRKHLLQLENRPLFEFIFEYLTKQKRFTWQEIVTLETQILENQRLRLRPVDEDTGKDELMAFEKKGKMTVLYKEWYITLKEFYDEFYGDNENVRAIHRINRANMASLENMAF